MTMRFGTSPLNILAAGAGLALLIGPAPVLAQNSTSRAIVQPLPSKEVQRLNRALLSLAKRPKSMSALLEAGDAAVAVNDLDAALGFYGRAREIEPGNAKVAAGLATVYLRSGRPLSALPLFDEAQSKGASTARLYSDRALALDMVGSQAEAQGLYARALERDSANDEAKRRLAISYAISGNSAAFESTLRPLVDKRDFAAFRARAFGLAIMGEQDRASAIVEAVMPRDLAGRITPYLEFMPRLTASQQAAAANMGIFPKAADIGRDTPEIAAYQSGEPIPRPVAVASAPSSADSRLEPVGKPLGENPTAGVRVVEVNRPVPAPAPAPAVKRPVRLTDAFSDLLASSQTSTEPAAGAVDIASIEVPREVAAAPPPEPKEPDHPRRIWVQLATGKDLKALGFDWRRIRRKAPDLLKPFKAHTVPWGQANRLLAGPVSTSKEARRLVNELSEKGIDTFSYTSPEGTEITPLK
ncbi:MAG: SPOR domain-containing protein [Pseudomonadota bacterium]|nr:SPOR domain-containing protein [Pseudomonadota bacterium]